MSDTPVLEPLEKKCPRCGGSSANSSNPSGRCSACLKKLASNKKKPGHWQRAQTKADDALRRQKGKNGTAKKKSSGLGSRKSIVKQTQAAEKKTGEKLSPDRKNNSKGYAASNTRMVPEKLNRGRHHVDPKKLRAWKKRLKKNDLDTASLYTLMKAKFQDNPEALELLKSLGADGLELYIELFDEQPLEKSAAPKLEPAQPAEPQGLAAHVGTTHTVEVHPDLDHLYRAKGLIKENNRPHLSIGHFKKHGFPNDIIKKIPRDAHGKVTPEMIDKHIESLPKKKVHVKIDKYTWGSQQHRPGDQYAVSVHMHPEEHMKMSPEHKEIWENIKDNQHKFSQDKDHNQIGWSRIDPHSKDDHWHIDEIQSDFQNKSKLKSKVTPRQIPLDHEDKLDALRHQAFQNWSQTSLLDPSNKDQHPEHVKSHPGYADIMSATEKANDAAKKVNDYSDTSTHYSDRFKAHKEAIRSIHDAAAKHGILKPKEHYEKLAAESMVKDREFNDNIDKHRETASGLLEHLSHDHEDPQHLVHSATNALARKLNVKSISMDTPEDQAKQSGLMVNRRGERSEDEERQHRYDWEDQHSEQYQQEAHEALWGSDEYRKNLIEHNEQNPNFKSGLEKIGGIDQISKVFEEYHPTTRLSDIVEDQASGVSKELAEKYNSLTTPEKDALNDFLTVHQEQVYDRAQDKMADHYPGYEEDEQRENDQEAENEKWERQNQSWNAHVDDHPAYRSLDAMTESNKDPHFKTAATKMSRDFLENVLRYSMGDSALYDDWTSDDSSEALSRRHSDDGDDTTHKDYKSKLASLSDDEKNAVQKWIRTEGDKFRENNKREEQERALKELSAKVPVHQLHTYKKRPSRLGMKRVPKPKILGHHPNDKAEEVQYMNLHKKLKNLLDTLKKTKN